MSFRPFFLPSPLIFLLKKKNPLLLFLAPFYGLSSSSPPPKIGTNFFFFFFFRKLQPLLQRRIAFEHGKQRSVCQFYNALPPLISMHYYFYSLCSIREIGGSETRISLPFVRARSSAGGLRMVCVLVVVVF